MNGSNTQIVYLKIYEGDTRWARFTIDENTIQQIYNTPNTRIKTFTPSKQQYTLKNLDGVLTHYLIRELIACENCRRNFLCKILHSGSINTIKLDLLPRSEWIDTIDYTWNAEIVKSIHERCELDNTLSWLSTLGGAFSALGDYYSNCAEIAGKISVQQLQLAVRLGDPNIAARCRLYFALSLIQKKYFRVARRIVVYEYRNAQTAIVCDGRLLKMCQGIWSKLRYEKSLHNNS